MSILRLSQALAAVAVMFLLSTAVTAATTPLEIRYGPDGRLFAYPIAGGGVPSGNATIVVHNVAIFNATAKAIQVTSVRFDASTKGKLTNSLMIQQEALEAAAALWSRRQAAGTLKTNEPLLQVAKLIEGRPLSTNALLASGTGLMIARKPMVVSADADELVITAEGKAADGVFVAGTLRISIAPFKPAAGYRFPLCGRWLISGGLNLNGHHRWGASQEFAIDVLQVGSDTKTHSNDGSLANMFYAFGAPVVAVADGTVVTAQDALDDADQLRRADETEEQFESRMARMQDALIASGYRKLVGNHVVLRHANGEHSIYAHLKSGSLRVHEGDGVARGAQLAQVGNSGSSTEPHLHFSILDGADPFTSRSIPYQFEGLRFWDDADGGTGVLASGQIVEATDCAAGQLPR